MPASVRLPAVASAAGRGQAGRAAAVVAGVVVGMVLAACGPEWEDTPADQRAATPTVRSEDTRVATTRQPVEIPLTTQPRASTPGEPSSSGPPSTDLRSTDSAVSALTTVAPSTPAGDAVTTDGPRGENAVVCGFTEPDPAVVPLATSCAEGYLLTSYYRPAGAVYGSRLWGLDGNVWELRAKYDTGCPRRAELEAKGLPTPLAEGWGSEAGCRTDGEPFPYANVVSVPKLGAEPVRGSGCGANGGLGDRLADGTWSVRAARTDGVTLDFDITCVFFGEEALDRAAADGALASDVWYEVNGSDRLRSVVLGPRFQLRYGSSGELDAMCVDSGRPARFDESTLWREVPSWLVIRGGQAQLLLVTCAFG
jgi:hypothetical protein